MVPRLPPPTRIASPLMATLSGEARNATTYATSLASTMRPMLEWLASWASAFGSVRSVRVAPGCNATTLMPRLPRAPNRFVRERIAQGPVFTGPAGDEGMVAPLSRSTRALWKPGTSEVPRTSLFGALARHRGFW